MFQALVPRALTVLAAVLLTACGGSAVDSQAVATLHPAVLVSADPVPTAAERAAQEAHLLAYEQAQSIELNRQTNENQSRARILAYEEAAARNASANCANHDPSCGSASETVIN